MMTADHHSSKIIQYSHEKHRQDKIDNIFHSEKQKKGLYQFQFINPLIYFCNFCDSDILQKCVMDLGMRCIEMESNLSKYFQKFWRLLTFILEVYHEIFILKGKCDLFKEYL